MSWRGRISLVVFSAGLATLTACCGSGNTTPGVAGNGPPPPKPPPPPPSVTAPVDAAGDGMTGAAEATPAEDAEPTLLGLAGAPLVAKLDQRKAELAAARYAADFAKTYRDLKGLSADLALPMQTYFDEKDQAYYFTSEFFADYPFYDVDYEAEGTAVIVMMTYPPLRERAKATVEPGDDLFLDLLELMYRDARGMGWNNLESRTWDYGGCSPLGSGLHLQILLAAEKARGESDLFTAEIAEIRKVVLKDITEDSELFPYCGLTEIEGPTPKEKLRAETQQILDQVTLSDAERESLEARVQAAFGGAAPAAKAADAADAADAAEPTTPRHGKMKRP